MVSFFSPVIWKEDSSREEDAAIAQLSSIVCLFVWLFLFVPPAPEAA